MEIKLKKACGGTMCTAGRKCGLLSVGRQVQSGGSRQAWRVLTALQSRKGGGQSGEIKGIGV